MIKQAKEIYDQQVIHTRDTGRKGHFNVKRKINTLECLHEEKTSIQCFDIH